MEVHRDRRMGWQWECCLCSVSGGRTASREELGEYDEPGRDGGVLGLKDGMAVRMLLVLGFGWANGPEGRAGRV